MKTKIPKLSQTVRWGLKVFKERILKMPCTKETSNLAGCIDYVLEEGLDSGQTKNSGQN